MLYLLCFQSINHVCEQYLHLEPKGFTDRAPPAFIQAVELEYVAYGSY